MSEAKNIPIANESIKTVDPKQKAMYGVVNLIGRSTKDGGEIFGDYENNKAQGAFSSTHGTLNTSGSKIFRISGDENIQYNTNTEKYTILLDISTNSSDIQDYIGNASTAVMRYNSWYYCTDIEGEISNKKLYIHLKCPYGGPSSDKMELTEPAESVFCLIDEPEAGTTTMGIGSFVGGINNIAACIGSVAFGQDNKVYGNHGVAIGRENETVYQGIVLGRQNKTYKETGIGIGIENIIKNQVGVGIGRQNQVSGQYGVAIGSENISRPQVGIVLGNNSIVDEGGKLALGGCALSNTTTPIAINTNENKYYFEIGGLASSRIYAQNYLGLDRNLLNLGFGNVAPLDTNASRYKVVIGSMNTHNGSASILIGHKSTATTNAVYGIALGDNLTLNNLHQIVIGNNAVASNQHNVSIGYETNTSGLGATAFGWENYASGSFSSVFGKRNIASGQSQFVVGEANARDDNALFIVGNGNSNHATIGSFNNSPGRSNAFVVKKDGTAEIGMNMANNYAKYLKNIIITQSGFPDLSAIEEYKNSDKLATFQVVLDDSHALEEITTLNVYSMTTEASKFTILNNTTFVFTTVINTPSSFNFQFYKMGEYGHETSINVKILKTYLLNPPTACTNGPIATTGWVQRYLGDLMQGMPSVSTNLSTSVKIAEASHKAWSGTTDKYEQTYIYYDENNILQTGNINIPSNFPGIQAIVDTNTQIGGWYTNGILQVEHGGTGTNTLNNFLMKDSTGKVDLTATEFTATEFKFNIQEDNKFLTIFNNNTNVFSVGREDSTSKIILGDYSDSQPWIFIKGKDTVTINNTPTDVKRGLIITDDAIYKHYGDRINIPQGLILNPLGNVNQMSFTDSHIQFNRPVRFSGGLEEHSYKSVGRPRLKIFDYTSTNWQYVGENSYQTGVLPAKAQDIIIFEENLDSNGSIIPGISPLDNLYDYSVYEIQFQGLVQSVIAVKTKDENGYYHLRGTGGSINSSGELILTSVDITLGLGDKNNPQDWTEWIKPRNAGYFKPNGKNPSKFYSKNISYIYGIA